jgi:cell wall-associated NlpC family hydrolase
VRQKKAPVSVPAVGDLVFFGAPAYHVGIYAGNGMMWDSPHTGMAVSKRSIFSGSATFGRV